jgi:hypothetical protein
MLKRMAVILSDRVQKEKQERPVCDPYNGNQQEMGSKKQKEPTAPFVIDGGCAAPYSASSRAYAVTSHLAPTSSNCICTRLCWPTPSKLSTIPSPNFGWSTRWPSVMPLASKLCCTSFWLKRPYWVGRLT